MAGSILRVLAVNSKTTTTIATSRGESLHEQALRKKERSGKESK